MNILAQKVLIIFHKVYKMLVSPFFGNCCRFYPTCSDYTLEAILKYGFFKGIFLGIKRIFKCNPRHPGGEDFLK